MMEEEKKDTEITGLKKKRLNNPNLTIGTDAWLQRGLLISLFTSIWLTEL